MMRPSQRRRERERARHRAEILAAALHEFARRGFADTSMLGVADRAEFAVGTLYKFFRNKEDLYAAVIEETLNTVLQRARSALEAPGGEVERLERFMDVTTLLFHENPELARMYFGQTAIRSLTGEGRPTVPAAGAQHAIDTLLENLFRDGIRKSAFVDVNPRMLVAALNGITEGLFREYLNNPGSFTAKDIAAWRRHLFLDSVRTKPRIRLSGAPA